MFILQNYLIKDKTYCLKGVRKEGIDYTLVMEEKRIFLVKKSPEELAEDTVSFYGYDLEGARKAATQFLGTKKAGVFIVNPNNTVCLLPAKSLIRTEYYLINVQHIQHVEYLGDQTKVTFRNGRTILLSSREAQFSAKMQAAEKWRMTIIERNTRLNSPLFQSVLEFEYNPEIGTGWLEDGELEDGIL